MDTSAGIKVLKFSAEYLGLVKDWKNPNYTLIRDIIEDMRVKEVIDLGYRKYPDQDHEVSGPFLGNDISEIVFELGINPNFTQETELKPSAKTLFDAYKLTESYNEIVRKHATN